MDEVTTTLVISKNASFNEQVAWFIENFGMTEAEAERELSLRVGERSPWYQRKPAENACLETVFLKKN
jgi:hypothetical protein